MIFREAHANDIPQIMEVRLAVIENPLTDPTRVTAADCEEYLFSRGKGWVASIDNKIQGFAIADLRGHNIWALFVRPNAAKKGVGKELHRLMLDWYFSKTKETVWLGTDPGTRAEAFYRLQGWTEKGLKSNGELKFEMSYSDWIRTNNPHEKS